MENNKKQQGIMVVIFVLAFLNIILSLISYLYSAKKIALDLPLFAIQAIRIIPLAIDIVIAIIFVIMLLQGLKKEKTPVAMQKPVQPKQEIKVVEKKVEEPKEETNE